MNPFFSDDSNFRSRAKTLIEAGAAINILDILGESEATGSPAKPMPSLISDTSMSRDSHLQIDKDNKIEQHLGKLSSDWKQLDGNSDNKLSRLEIKRAIQSNKDPEKAEFLNFLDKNFDTLRSLDDTTGSASPDITLKDVNLLADMHRQTELDRKFFDKSKEFALNNFEIIDTDKNGQLDINEVKDFSLSTSLNGNQLELLKYMELRLNNNYSKAVLQEITDGGTLPFGNKLWPGSASEFFGKRYLSRQDLANTTLSARMEETQRSIYGQVNAAFDADIGKVVGASFALLPLVGKNWNAGLMVLSGIGGATAGHYAGKELGHYTGRNFYDTYQKGKLEHLVV